LEDCLGLVSRKPDPTNPSGWIAFDVTNGKMITQKSDQF